MESQMGSGFQMLHPRLGLTGDATLYGQSVLYFRRPLPPMTAPPATTVTSSKPRHGPPSTAPLNDGTSTSATFLQTKMTEKERDQVQTLSKLLAQSYSALADTFETRYVKRKDTWGSHGGEQRYCYLLSSLNTRYRRRWRYFRASSSVRAQGSEWDELVAMGSNILPDVVNKLTLSGEVFATELCMSQHSYSIFIN